MSPRPYQMGRRQEAREQTRASVLAAARALLMADDGIMGFTVDAVARQAGVARMTVYYQFASKAGLLEALFDDLARRGDMEHLATAFRQSDLRAALETYAATFAHFYQTDRLVLRRLRALAVLDPDLWSVIRARDERRRQGLRALLARQEASDDASGDALSPASRDEVIEVLYSLLSFEFFDTLAGPDRSIEDVVPVVQSLAWTAVGALGRSTPQPTDSVSPQTRACERPDHPSLSPAGQGTTASSFPSPPGLRTREL